MHPPVTSTNTESPIIKIKSVFDMISPRDAFEHHCGIHETSVRMPRLSKVFLRWEEESVENRRGRRQPKRRNSKKLEVIPLNLISDAVPVEPLLDPIPAPAAPVGDRIWVIEQLLKQKA